MSTKSPGADHWTFDFEGVKGGGGRLRVVVDFEKKILQARVEREKLQAARIKF